MGLIPCCLHHSWRLLSSHCYEGLLEERDTNSCLWWKLTGTPRLSIFMELLSQALEASSQRDVIVLRECSGSPHSYIYWLPTLQIFGNHRKYRDRGNLMQYNYKNFSYGGSVARSICCFCRELGSVFMVPHNHLYLHVQRMWCLLTASVSTRNTCGRHSWGQNPHPHEKTISNCFMKDGNFCYRKDGEFLP